MKAAITTMALIVSLTSPAFAAGTDGDEQTFYPDQRSTDIDNKAPRKAPASPAPMESERGKKSEATDKMKKDAGGKSALEENSQDWDEKPFFEDDSGK